VAGTGTAAGRAVECGCGRFREVQATMSSQSSGKGELAPDEENVLKAKAARAELETMRKQSARLKVEFSAAIAAAFS